MSPQDLAEGGGVVVDISGVSKPAAAATVVKQASKYVSTMNLLHKPIRAITLSGPQYATVFDAIAKSRDDKGLQVVGLRFNEIPVERAA